MATVPFDFYGKLLDKLGTALETYVLGTATNICIYIEDVAITLLVIYTTLWGWSMMRGAISEPISDGIGRIVRLSIITTLALKVGYYNTYIVQFLFNAPDAMAAVITAPTSPAAAPAGPAVSNASYLDSLMTQMYDLGDAFYQLAFSHSVIFPDFGPLIIGLAIMLAGLLVTGYAAFLLVMAKMGLSIILAIGPIFILLMVFESTKKFFDSWLGQALNYVFLVVLTAAGLKLILSILTAYLVGADAHGLLSNPKIDGAIPAIALALIGFLVLVQLPSIASALGGGVAISTLGAVALAYGAAKGVASAGAATAKALRPGRIAAAMKRGQRNLARDVAATKAVGKAVASGARATGRAGKRGASAAYTGSMKAYAAVYGGIQAARSNRASNQISKG